MALATLAGQTIVTAAVTDAWESARQKVARFFGRGDPGRTALAERRLDQTRDQLVAPSGTDLTELRNSWQNRWADRLADLLEEYPDAEAELRALVAEIAAQLPAGAVTATDHSLAAGRDITISADRGSVAAGVIHGNVAPPDPPPPGPPPPGPANG
jgi:hypothetical protein